MRITMIWLALLACGWSAGFFWSFSAVVMPGLRTAEPQHALAAMQAINANVRSALFAFTFFGAVALPLLAAGLSWGQPAAGWMLAAGLVQALGVLAVTLLFNVPMNEALAGATPGDWPGYDRPWTAWNHLRSAAATASLLLMAQGLRLAP